MDFIMTYCSAEAIRCEMESRRRWGGSLYLQNETKWQDMIVHEIWYCNGGSYYYVLLKLNNIN